jgi:hypothetical protein
MAYEKYKEVLPRKEFFKTWEQKTLAVLTTEMKDYIYMKYVLKCKVFQRDNFKCQNIECKHTSHKLTLHHIKWRKNNGEDKARNGVTLCGTCHAGYHKAKIQIVFADETYLPPHIRGHTFKLDRPDAIDWKKIRAEMKGVRNAVKVKLGDRLTKGQWFKLTWEQIAHLMRWLYIPYEDEDD